jgi:hypothetical protein
MRYGQGNKDKLASFPCKELTMFIIEDNLQITHVLVYSDDVQLLNGSVIRFTRVDDSPFAIIVPTIPGKLVMIYN